MIMRKGINPVNYVKISGKTKVTAEDRETGYRQSDPGLAIKVISIRDAVVHMNSTTLEVVDRYYEWKGYISLFIFSMLMALAAFFISCGFVIISDLFFSIGHPKFGSLITVLLCFIISSPLWLILGSIAFAECYGNTHYPIIFNRKTQMVHYYRGEGDIVSAPWREIVFCPFCYGNIPKQWGINGYVLADDGESITDTIPLPGTQISGSDELQEIWQFIRCYMEEDCMDHLTDLVPYTLPIADKRESWIFSALYLAGKTKSWLGALILPVKIPCYLLILLPRWIVMRTCKIPRWPQAILDTCWPDDEDDLDINEENNPDPLWQYVGNFVLVKDVRQTLYRKYAAMRRINAMLRKKYAPKSQQNAAHNRRQA